MAWYEKSSLTRVRPVAFFDRRTQPASKPDWMGQLHPTVVDDPGPFSSTADEAELGFAPQEPNTEPAWKPSLPPPSGTQPTASGWDQQAVLDALEQQSAELRAQYQTQLARLEEAIAEACLLREQVLSGVEHQLVELAGKIARRVIHRELQADPIILLGLAKEGIEALGERERVVIRLGELIEEDIRQAFIERIQDRVPQCQIVYDPRLAPGACIVEAELGRVDESIDVRLDNVLSKLLPPASER